MGAAGEMLVVETDAGFQYGPATGLAASSTGKLRVGLLTLEVGGVGSVKIVAFSVEKQMPKDYKARATKTASGGR